MLHDGGGDGLMVVYSNDDVTAAVVVVPDCDSSIVGIAVTSLASVYHLLYSRIADVVVADAGGGFVVADAVVDGESSDELKMKMKLKLGKKKHYCYYCYYHC